MKYFIFLFLLSPLVHAKDLKSLVEDKWANDSLLIVKTRPKVTIRDLKKGLTYLGQCERKKIYALIPSELEVEVSGKLSEEEISEVKSLYSGGSGGATHLFIQEDPRANQLVVLFQDVLLGFEEKASKVNCPNIKVLVHGSFFDRPGNVPGATYLVWNKKKTKLMLKKIKGVKPSDT